MNNNNNTSYNIIHQNSSNIDDINDNDDSKDIELNILNDKASNENLISYLPVTNDNDNSNSNILPIQTIQRLIIVRNQASLFSSYSNLTSTIIGAGFLALPYAFSQFGYVLGLITLTLAGLSSAFSLILLSLCAKHITDKPSSFYAVAELAFPKVASYLIDFAVAIKCWGVATSYIIIISDLMPVACQQTQCYSFFNERDTWVTIGFIIVSPLCCFHSIDALKWTSSISLLFILMITVLVVLYSIPNNGTLWDPCPIDITNGIQEKCTSEVTTWNVGINSLKVFPIFVFAFTCQQNIFSIVNELKVPTPTRVNTVVIASIGSSYCLYVIIALCGYFTFGSEVKSDLLLNFPMNRISSFARVCVSLTVLFHYPLQLNPARKSILSIIRSIDNEEVLQPSLYFRKYFSVTFGFLISSYIVALSTKDLGLMMSLVGGTASTIVSYILPGAFYCMLHYRSNSYYFYAAFLMLVVGLIIIPLCIISQFL